MCLLFFLVRFLNLFLSFFSLHRIVFQLFHDNQVIIRWKKVQLLFGHFVLDLHWICGLKRLKKDTDFLKGQFILFQKYQKVIHFIPSFSVNRKAD